MKMKNLITGDVMELPPPGDRGQSVVLLNGKVVEYVLYSDENGGSITLGDGRALKPGDEFAEYLVARWLSYKKPGNSGPGDDPAV
jgi:hypothetical protein